MKEGVEREFKENWNCIWLFVGWLRGRSLAVGETMTGETQVLYPLLWLPEPRTLKILCVFFYYFGNEMKGRVWGWRFRGFNLRVNLRVFSTLQSNNNDFHYLKVQLESFYCHITQSGWFNDRAPQLDRRACHQKLSSEISRLIFFFFFSMLPWYFLEQQYLKC